MPPTEQTLNEVIDALKPLFDQIAKVIQGYKDEAQTQKERGDALQTALDEQNSSGNLVDPAHADTLRGFADTLTPLLSDDDPNAPDATAGVTQVAQGQSGELL